MGEAGEGDKYPEQSFESAPTLPPLTYFILSYLIIGKNTLYGIDMTEVSECELIYQKYWFSSK